MALEHAKPGEVIDLGSLGSTIGYAKTAALIKTDRFEVMRLVVPAGVTIPAHQVPGYLTLYCLEGRIQLSPSGAEMGSGDWIYLERGEPHSVRGIEDSSLLLTIFFDEGCAVTS
jgi:quercetin dioxygenase-like cupin family protein